MKLITQINIPKLSGKKVIVDSKLFAYIDPDFKNWKADEKGKPTKAMKLDVFEMTEDKKFSDMMLPDNLLTQEQILYFVEHHKEHLRQDGWATFFPFRSNDENFVASVIVHSGRRPSVDVSRFSHGSVWCAVFRLRVVCPATSTSVSKDVDPLSLESRIESLEQDMEKIKKFLII